MKSVKLLTVPHYYACKVDPTLYFSEEEEKE